MNSQTMDEIDDFYNFSKPFNRVLVSGGYVNGRVVEDKTLFNKMPEREKIGKEYAEEFKMKETKQLINAFMTDDDRAGPSISKLDDIEDDDIMSEDQEQNDRLSSDRMKPVFQKFDFKLKPKMDLPIIKYKNVILDAIKENPVVILQGPTGCGKTTQVPQYIIEECYRNNQYCNIVVTQPRRIAATSIAKRVAYERHCDVGTLVGYKVGLNEATSEDTKILYCTTGVLLQTLVSSKNMDKYTHIILDEVHEREEDMDFLLIVVRRFLSTNSRNVKIILMSATIEPREFSDYFKIPKAKGYLPAPVLEVENSQMFELSIFYFDQLDKLKLDFDIDYANPGICDAMYKVASKIALICDRLIDVQDDDGYSTDYKPSIIVFLPGINEIDKMAYYLQSYIHNFGNNLQILKLHSSIPSEEQSRAFKKPPPNQRKIILATNIAESSITVPDIKFVIDFCLTRVLHTDSTTSFTTLKTEWASRSNCTQRAGRAGRVMDGRVYRLVDKRFFENGMSESSSPELQRCPLENVVLKAKMLDMGPPHTILALAMNPPNLSDICNTILILKEIGALLKTSNGTSDHMDGDITQMGRIMARLPLDLKISKLIILGHIFSITDEAITIAAGMNVKSIFTYTNTAKGYSKKLYWAAGSYSDAIAIYNAYTAWKSQCEQSDSETVKNWTKRYYLEPKALAEMAELIREIKSRLEHFDMKKVHGPNRVNWTDMEKPVILKIIFAGAFYPNYFQPLTATGREFSERQSVTTLGGKDPSNTVFFTGFEHEKHIGSLYKKQIKNILSQADIQLNNDIKISFGKGTNKIFATFLDNRTGNDYHQTDDLIPGKVHPNVYKAVRYRKEKSRHPILVMPHKEAVEFAQAQGLGIWDESVGWVPKKKYLQNPEHSVLPSFYKSSLVGEISHIEHCFRFYVRPMESKNRDFCSNIDLQLNASGSALATFDDDHFFDAGDMVAAPLTNQKYARAILRNYKGESSSGISIYTVFFIDKGKTDDIMSSNFRKLEDRLRYLQDLPARTFECSLAEIQPAAVHAPKGVWTEDAIIKFKEMVLGKTVTIDVFSIVNGVANVFLKKGDYDINRELISMKYAMFSEESYMSKMDHELRERKIRYADLNGGNIPVDELYAHLEQYYEPDEDEVRVPEEKLKMHKTISGPHSPLEVKASSMMRSGTYKSVMIENDSVNSVLLDTDPQDFHEKLIVAGAVSKAHDGKLVLRQTTLMPNIPGFNALMVLLFCPTCQITKDEEGTRAVTLLAGLGYNEITKASLFPEHDIVLNFDIYFTDDDMAMINKLRYTIDTILYMDPENQVSKVSHATKETLQLKIKNTIIKLLEPEREYVEIQNTITDYIWKEEPESSKKMKNDINIYENPIYPLHKPLKLVPIASAKIEYLRKHCKELHKMAKMDIPLMKNGIICQCCSITIETTIQLRIHLYSKLHRDRETQIKKY